MPFNDLRDTRNPTPPAQQAEEELRRHTILWTPKDWELLERAAERFSETHSLKVAPVDIIKSGAIRRAEEILTPQSAA